MTHLSYSNVMATIAVMIAMGGTAYAAATITGADVVDESLTGADIAAKSLRGEDIAGASIGSQKITDNSLTAIDLAPDSVGTSEAANDSLTGADIVESTLGKIPAAASADTVASDAITSAKVADNSLTGADIDESTLSGVNADKVDGIDSSDLVQLHGGRGTVLADRIVLAANTGRRSFFEIPGLGELYVKCEGGVASMEWHNTTTDAVDVWSAKRNNAGEHVGVDGSVLPGSVGINVAVDSGPSLFGGQTLALGKGDSVPLRIATVHAYALTEGAGWPCGFQAQATVWTLP